MIVLSIPFDNFQGFLGDTVTLVLSHCVGWLLSQRWSERACILRRQDCEESPTGKIRGVVIEEAIFCHQAC